MKAAIKVGGYDIAALRVASNDSTGRYDEGNWAGFSWVKEARLKGLTSTWERLLWVISRHDGPVRVMSALPPIADNHRCSWNVRKVPLADIHGQRRFDRRCKKGPSGWT